MKLTHTCCSSTPAFCYTALTVTHTSAGQSSRSTIHPALQFTQLSTARSLGAPLLKPGAWGDIIADVGPQCFSFVSWYVIGQPKGVHVRGPSDWWTCSVLQSESTNNSPHRAQSWPTMRGTGAATEQVCKRTCISLLDTFSFFLSVLFQRRSHNRQTDKKNHLSFVQRGFVLFWQSGLKRNSYKNKME